MLGIYHQNFIWPTNDTKFPVFLRFSQKFQPILKKSYKFQVILRNSQEFLGILRNFQGEYNYFSWNSQEFLGIPSQLYVNLEFRVRITVKIHTLDSQEFLGIFSQELLGNSQEFLGILKVIQTNNSPQTKTILFQNVKSLHLHIDDVQSDYNIQKADVNIFVESKLCSSGRDDTYQLHEFTLYRNDFSPSNIRTCYGTTVYIKNDLNCTKIPYRCNFNNLEITVMVLSQPIPNIHVIGIYCLKT